MSSNKTDINKSGKKEQNKKVKEKESDNSENNKSENNESSEEEEESELESLKQNNISIYKSLYPPVKDNFFFEDNTTINNKILKLNQEQPNLRYKNAKSSKNINNKKAEDDISSINEEEEEAEDLKMTDKFLDDLIKVPCPISKSKIIAIISHFIRKSKLIEKLESEYQSDKKADLNNLSISCAENLSYMELKKGEILFKIGEMGNRFYFILRGFISILKLKEIFMVKISYYHYFNYCIKLLKENEIHILEETLKKNNAKIPYESIDNLVKIYKIVFQKKLYENITKQIITNNNLLLNFFSLNEQKLENYDIIFEELQNFEQFRNYKEWKNYLIKKIKPTKEDLDFFDQYNRLVNSKSEIYITCFCYEQFLYLGPGFFFGDSALEKGNIYTGGKRNATIRAETDVILGSLKSMDYADIIEPKRRMEKLKELGFLFNNFFFQEISIHLFEKNYFHLFSACEYARGNILFSTGVIPKSLILIKEGKILLELKTSVINLHKLIKYLYEYIYSNPLFMNLSHPTQKKLLNNDVISTIQKYVNDPAFKKLRGYSQKFIDELNKDRKFNIAFIAENETIGIQEIFLSIPYIMKGSIVSKKVLCYEITIEYLQKILSDEKQIVIPFIKYSINKIFSLIQRIQNIKQHYVNSFIQKYEKGISSDKIKSSSSSINIIHKNKSNNNYILKTENSESNINNIYPNINESNLFNQINNKKINFDTNKIILSDNSKTISVPDNKSPLKKYYYLRPKSKNILNKLKKNIKSNIAPNNNINLLNKENKIKNKTRNFFNYNNKFDFPKIKSNSKIAQTSTQLSSLFDTNEKKGKDLLIGNKYLSLEKLKNQFNEINFHYYDNDELVQVIQSTKYNTHYNNNDMNNINITNTMDSNNETKKESLLKARPTFLNYHLSYVPLNNLNNSKSSKSNYNSLNNDSIDNTNTNSSQLQIPILSQYSTKENTKCNSFRKKINSRNYLKISNSNFAFNLKAYNSIYDSKDNSKNKRNNFISYDTHKKHIIFCII